MGSVLSICMILAGLVIFNKLKKMKNNSKFLKIKKLSADEFFQSVLYDSKIGYYNSKNPLGLRVILSPLKISRLFSEILAIWIISVWEVLESQKILTL